MQESQQGGITDIPIRLEGGVSHHLVADMKFLLKIDAKEELSPIQMAVLGIDFFDFPLKRAAFIIASQPGLISKKQLARLTDPDAPYYLIRDRIRKDLLDIEEIVASTPVDFIKEHRRNELFVGLSMKNQDLDNKASSSEEDATFPYEEEVASMGIEQGSREEIALREMLIRNAGTELTRIETFIMLGLNPRNPSHQKIYESTFKSLGGKTRESNVQIVRNSRGRYARVVEPSYMPMPGFLREEKEEIQSVQSPEAVFEQLMELPPGEREEHGVRLPQFTRMGLAKIRKRNSQLARRIEQQGVDNEIGWESIRLLLSDLTPEEFDGMTGDPFDILENILGSDDLEDYLLIKAVNPSKEPSLDDIFWQSISGAIESLWDFTIPALKLREIQTKNPQKYGAFEIIQNLKSAGWSKEQLGAFIKKHFSLHITE